MNKLKFKYYSKLILLQVSVYLIGCITGFIGGICLVVVIFIPAVILRFMIKIFRPDNIKTAINAGRIKDNIINLILVTSGVIPIAIQDYIEDIRSEYECKLLELESNITAQGSELLLESMNDYNTHK